MNQNKAWGGATYNKGFTLIELLAVIVILAIIALIATPIVLNIIKNSKDSSIKRNIELYLDAVEQGLARSSLNGEVIKNGIYYIFNNGDICSSKVLNNECLGNKITVDVNGSYPISGYLSIKDGHVYSYKNLKLTEKTYVTNYLNDFNITNFELEPLCEPVTIVTTGNIPTGEFNYGDEYICNLGDNDKKTFFVLDKDENTVSLIMNANVDIDGKAITAATPLDKNIVKWSYDQSNHKDEDESKQATYAKDALTNCTQSWTKLNSLQIKLPTASQIVRASFDEYWDGFTPNINKLLPLWLVDYFNATLHPVSDIYGYWTSTPYPFSNNLAYFVYAAGYLNNDVVFQNIHYGIRPVIVIPKYELN